LPDDGVVDGLTGVLVPHHGRLALVGDAHGGQVAAVDIGTGECPAGHFAGIAPDLHGIVLHPAGLGQDLLVLDLAGVDDLTAVVEDDRPGAGRALVDGEYVVRHVSPLQ